MEAVDTCSPPRQASKRRRRWFRSRSAREALFFYASVSPWLLGFVGLTVIPLVLGFLTSLTNYDGYNMAALKFVGLENYVRAIRDRDAWASLGRTFRFSAVAVPLRIALAFALAVALNQRLKGKGVFRALFYVPTIIPLVASMLTWRVFVDKNFGLLNAIISLIRPGTAVPWLTKYAIYVLVMFTVWGGVGGGMVILLAALQGIPRELKEAATIDGANAWQVFRSVTLPLMTPVVFFQLVTGLIGSLQIVTEPFLLTPTTGSLTILGTAPRQSIYFYLVHVFMQLFSRQYYGYAVALLWILFVIVLALTLLIFRTSRYWVYYEVEQ